MNRTDQKNRIYPVILPVPEEYRYLKGRDKVLYLSRHARQALNISAQKSGFVLYSMLKNEKGMPLPSNGKYWSVTHKPEYVGGVTAPYRIGIDIEKIRVCSKGLFKKAAIAEEWNLVDSDPFLLFFRYWTAKEAVIKTKGTGIKDLLKCRITKIVDDNNLIIHFDNEKWMIEHVYFDGHIASVVKSFYHIQWVLDS